MTIGIEISEMTSAGASLSAGALVPVAFGGRNYSFDLGAALALETDLSALAASGGSSLVSFLQSGTGAVAQSVQTKLRRTVHLTDMGAVGNNSTDDTVNLQKVLTAYPSHAVLDGAGLIYRVSDSLKVPNGSDFVSVVNATFVQTADKPVFEGVTGVTPIQFFELSGVRFDCSAGHTTVGRRIVDLSRMAQSRVSRCFLYGSAGKSVGVYMLPPASGDQGYYNTIEQSYFAGFKTGIMFDDGSGPALGSNSNTAVRNRLQPGTGNTAIYVGANTSDITVDDNRIESVGGTGIYNAAEATIITSNRLESLDVGIAYTSVAAFGTEMGNTFSSNAANRTWAGSSQSYNTVISEYVLGGYPQHYLAGDVFAGQSLSILGNHMDFGTAAPVTGTWARGAVRFNSTPSAGGTPGWICVTAGSPGVWKAMASVAA